MGKYCYSPHGKVVHSFTRSPETPPQDARWPPSGYAEIDAMGDQLKEQREVKAHALAKISKTQGAVLRRYADNTAGGFRLRIKKREGRRPVRYRVEKVD